MVEIYEISQINDTSVLSGVGEAIGVEGHVKQLFQEAQDPKNLSPMYPGWAQWI